MWALPLVLMLARHMLLSMDPAPSRPVFQQQQSRWKRKQVWRAWTLLSKCLEEYSEIWAAEGAMKCKKGWSRRTRQGQNAHADRTNSKKETKDRDN